MGDEILLQITQIGKECKQPCAIGQQVGECVMPTEGIFARVIKGGKLKIGDKIEIFGTINNKNHISAEKVLITPRWKYDLIFIRSLPAIPFALFLFFRTWKFNRSSFRFERRKKRDA